MFTGFSLVSLFKIYMIFKSSEEVHLNPLSASVAHLDQEKRRKQVDVEFYCAIVFSGPGM